MAADELYFSDHFQYGCSVAGTNVDGPALFSAAEILQCTNVRRGQIGDMNVVPDCSAVGRSVIGPKDPQRLALSQGRANGQRDQVSFVLVFFAEFAFRIAASGVEIAESHPTKLPGH